MSDNNNKILGRIVTGGAVVAVVAFYVAFDPQGYVQSLEREASHLFDAIVNRPLITPPPAIQPVVDITPEAIEKCFDAASKGATERNPVSNSVDNISCSLDKGIFSFSPTQGGNPHGQIGKSKSDISISFGDISFTNGEYLGVPADGVSRPYSMDEKDVPTRYQAIVKGAEAIARKLSALPNPQP